MGVWAVVLAILLVVLAGSGLPQAVWNLYRKWKAVRSIPGWPTHWFWGNLHQFHGDEATMMKFIQYIQEENLKMAKLWMGPLFLSVHITHCDTTQMVMKLPKDRSV